MQAGPSEQAKRPERTTAERRGQHDTRTPARPRARASSVVKHTGFHAAPTPSKPRSRQPVAGAMRCRSPYLIAKSRLLARSPPRQAWALSRGKHRWSVHGLRRLNPNPENLHRHETRQTFSAHLIRCAFRQPQCSGRYTRPCAWTLSMLPVGDNRSRSCTQPDCCLFVCCMQWRVHTAACSRLFSTAYVWRAWVLWDWSWRRTMF